MLPRSPVLFFVINLMAAVCSSAAAPLPASASSPAQNYHWENVIIGAGGYVSGLIFHPTEPQLLYARTDVGGAYRFDFENHRWIPLNDNIGRNQAELTGIFSLALDPSLPDRVYLAAGSYAQIWGDSAALLRSDDRGHTWDQFALPIKLGGNADGRNTGEHLLVHPDRTETLFLASSGDGLWRSDDRGETWAIVRGGLPESIGLTSILAGPAPEAPDLPRTLYTTVAEFQGPVLYRSPDGGASWIPILGQPTGLIVHQAAFSTDGSLYLTYCNNFGPNGITGGALWRFDPKNETWTNLTPSLANGATTAPFGFAGLALDPTSANSIIVSSLNRWKPGNEIWRSTDAGQTWHSLVERSTWDHSSAPYTAPFRPHWITDVALDPTDPNQAWFVTGYGVWHSLNLNVRSPDEGPHWSFDNNGLEETVADELISPPIGAPLLSALGDIGGFRHDDLASSPDRGTLTGGHGTSSTIDFAALNPLEMVRTHSAENRAARSHDGGQTWLALPSCPVEATAHGPGRLAIAADASRLVWLPKDAGVYFSTDDGSSWQPSRIDFRSSAGHLTSYLVADRVDPNIFYLYDPEAGRFFVSTDAGESFTLSNIFAALGGIPRAEPRRTGQIWVPTSRGLYASTSPGRHFQKLPSVDAAYQLGFGRSADAKVRDTIYLHGRVNDTEGLFRSIDSGASWTQIDNPKHRYGWLRVIIGDSQTFGRVYLGTSGRGIIVGDPDTP